MFLKVHGKSLTIIHGFLELLLIHGVYWKGKPYTWADAIYQRTLHFRTLRAIHEILCTLDGDYEEQCNSCHEP